MFDIVVKKKIYIYIYEIWYFQKVKINLFPIMNSSHDCDIDHNVALLSFQNFS